METGLIIIAIVLIVVVVGMLGMLFSKRSFNKKSIYGTLYVNLNNADGTNLFLDLDVPVEEVATQKQINLNIHTIR